jgi:hypothetical protein
MKMMREVCGKNLFVFLKVLAIIAICFFEQTASDSSVDGGTIGQRDGKLCKYNIMFRWPNLRHA